MRVGRRHGDLLAGQVLRLLDVRALLEEDVVAGLVEDDGDHLQVGALADRGHHGRRVRDADVGLAEVDLLGAVGRAAAAQHREVDVLFLVVALLHRQVDRRVVGEVEPVELQLNLSCAAAGSGRRRAPASASSERVDGHRCRSWSPFVVGRMSRRLLGSAHGATTCSTATTSRRGPARAPRSGSARRRSTASPSSRRR